MKIDTEVYCIYWENDNKPIIRRAIIKGVSSNSYKLYIPDVMAKGDYDYSYLDEVSESFEEITKKLKELLREIVKSYEEKLYEAKILHDKIEDNDSKEELIKLGLFIS